MKTLPKLDITLSGIMDVVWMVFMIALKVNNDVSTTTGLKTQWLDNTSSHS